MILVTTDKGLCGATQRQQLRAVTRYMNEHYTGASRYVDDRTQGSRFPPARYRRDIIAEATGIPDRPRRRADPARDHASPLRSTRRATPTPSLLCYASWISTHAAGGDRARADPGPRSRAAIRARAGPSADYIYEPDPESVLDGLLPRYVETQVFQALLENKASYHSAKMIAMQNATNAAGDLITSLTLYANKVRQAAITTELMEIVSGAEAMRASS